MMNETQLSSFNYQFDTNTGKCLYAQVGLHNESADSTEFVNASIRVKPDDLPGRRLEPAAVPPAQVFPG